MKYDYDVVRGRKYWGAMPLPMGAELMGTVTRQRETGALLRMSNGIFCMGNAGALKALPKVGFEWSALS